METKRPTQEQIKEFWEWCGLAYDGYGNPSRERAKNLPSPDLNNLFRYAMPVIIKGIMAQQECDEELAYAILFKKWLQKGHNATALFWVIWEVREWS